MGIENRLYRRRCVFIAEAGHASVDRLPDREPGLGGLVVGPGMLEIGEVGREGSEQRVVASGDNFGGQRLPSRGGGLLLPVEAVS